MKILNCSITYDYYLGMYFYEELIFDVSPQTKFNYFAPTVNIFYRLLHNYSFFLISGHNIFGYFSGCLKSVDTFCRQ